jgi:hypothetical protein
MSSSEGKKIQKAIESDSKSIILELKPKNDTKLLVSGKPI